MNMKYAQKKSINNKDVFIVEDHHHVLEAWFSYKNYKPCVVSLDHHSDTIPAYLRYSHWNCTDNRNNEVIEKYNIDLVRRFSNCNDLDEVLEAIKFLKHDEFHDAAIYMGLINKSIIINYQSGHGLSPSRIFNIDKEKVYSDEPIIVVPINKSNFCINDRRHCNSSCHSTSCICYNFNYCIDNKVLNHCISNVQKKTEINILEQAYILDIDLDFFHTFASINHDDAKNCHTLKNGYISDIPLNLNLTTFYSLISKAMAITIAKEKTCVDVWNNEYGYTKNLSSDLLLESLLEHIKVATRI